MSLKLNTSVESFFQSNYPEYLSKISEVSRSDNGAFFVDSNVPAWDFDKITQNIFKKNPPDSSDCILLSGKDIYFVEFKSGLDKLVDWKNFDPNKVVCKVLGDRPCVKLGTLLRQRDDYKEDALRQNIQLKASDSYRTFERNIISKMLQIDSGKSYNYRLHFVAVVDCEDIENDVFEDIMSQMSETLHVPETNHVSKIRSCLKRYARPDIWYDDVNVFGVQEFLDFLKKWTSRNESSKPQS